MDRSHRNKNPRKTFMVADMRDDIREALVEDARSQDISVNEAAVRVLCDTFGVKHSPYLNGLRGHEGSPTRFSGAEAANTTIVIRGGARLHRRLDATRRKRGGTLRGIVLEALALHYQLPAEPIGRRPRKKETTA